MIAEQPSIRSPGLKNPPDRASVSASRPARPKSPEFTFEREDWTLFRSLSTLSQKAGVPVHLLPKLVLKELADNALDAGGTVRVGPARGRRLVRRGRRTGDRRRSRRHRPAVLDPPATGVLQAAAAAHPRRAGQRAAGRGRRGARLGRPAGPGDPRAQARSPAAGQRRYAGHGRALRAHDRHPDRDPPGRRTERLRCAGVGEERCRARRAGRGLSRPLVAALVRRRGVLRSAPGGREPQRARAGGRARRLHRRQGGQDHRRLQGPRLQQPEPGRGDRPAGSGAAAGPAGQSLPAGPCRRGRGLAAVPCPWRGYVPLRRHRRPPRHHPLRGRGLGLGRARRLRQQLLGAGQPHADHRHGQPLALATRSHSQRLRPHEHPPRCTRALGHRSA